MSALGRMRDRRLTGPAGRAQTLGFGAAAFPIQLMAQTFSAFVVFFYADQLKVPAEWVAGAMVAHGILNALLNPLVGAVSDRRWTRWGRRVPWIALGIGPMIVAFVLIWMPPAGLDAAGLLVWFLVIVAVYDVTVVVVVLNVSALFPEIFRSTRERARGNTPRQLFGLVGMILGTAGAPLLYGTIGWAGMALALGVVCLGFFAWSLAGMVERPVDREAVRAREAALPWRAQLAYTFGNRAFVTYVLGSLFVQSSTSIIIASVPFYVRYSLNEPQTASTPILAAIFLAAVPAIVGWSWVVRRSSPRTALLWAVAVYAVASLAYLFPAGMLGAVLVGLGVGVGVGGVLQLLEVALAQVIDDDEKRTGLRREGIYFGANGFVVRGSVIVQAVAVAWVLTASGYDPAAGDHQAAAVDGGVRLLMGVLPAVAAALGWICFWAYPLRSQDSLATPDRDQDPESESESTLTA
ncbi:MFS transporter [Leifsonia poae]|uniref:MFS transporter n=1 Tax=Leifsonia poae TaxID=110933 RepID=UPI001CBD71F3|nr:MFS transporter [Leifsonia poae]